MNLQPAPWMAALLSTGFAIFCPFFAHAKAKTEAELAAPTTLRLEGCSGNSMSITDHTAISAIKAEAVALLEKKDYAGLEAAYVKLLGQKGSIYFEWYPTGVFLTAFDGEMSAADEVWLQTKANLAAWLEAVPKSLAARTALMEWWIEYAWKARGDGSNDTGTEEGRKLMGERFDEAYKIYKATVKEEKVNDPCFYAIAMDIGLGQGWGFEEIALLVQKARALDPGCLAIYLDAGNFLTPGWYGSIEDVARFAQTVSRLFEGEEADYMYAVIMTHAKEERETEPSLFTLYPEAYDRIKRGFETGIKNTEGDWWKSRWASELALFAMLKGDNATAQQLFLEWGSSMWLKAFFQDFAYYLALRNESGAGEKINAAIQLEREGKLDEAEALYRSFSTQPRVAGWLGAFYERQGMREQVIAQGGSVFSEAKKIPFEEIRSMIWPALMRGEWEFAEEAAQIFDRKQPESLTGLAALFFCAAHRGDKEAGQALLTSFLANTTDQPALKLAQELLREEKKLEEVGTVLRIREEGGRNQQAALTVIGCYLSLGELAKAREVRGAFMPEELDVSIGVPLNIFPSLSYGSLSRLFDEPQKKPSE